MNTTVGHTGSYACGESVSPSVSAKAVLVESGSHPLLQVGVCSQHENIPTKVILKVADRDCSVAVYKFLNWIDV